MIFDATRLFILQAGAEMKKGKMNAKLSYSEASLFRSGDTVQTLLCR
jgi:hypothetical protein